MGQFSAGPINKAVTSFTKQFDKSTRTVMEDILRIILYGVCAVLNS